MTKALRYNVAFIRISALLLLALACFFPSCKKEEPEEEYVLPASYIANMTLLTAHPWIMSGWTVEPAYQMENGPLTNDIFKYLRPCSKDDFFTLYDGKDAIYDEGPTKCDPDDPQEVTAIGTFFPAKRSLFMTL